VHLFGSDDKNRRISTTTGVYGLIRQSGESSFSGGRCIYGDLHKFHGSPRAMVTS